MDVDQDPPERTTPLGTPFNDGYTTYQHGGASSADPPASKSPNQKILQPLYTASQETGYTTVTSGHQTQHPASDHMDTVDEAEAEELATTEAAEAKALRNTYLEAEAAAAVAET
jgi:hypothetical protein